MRAVDRGWLVLAAIFSQGSLLGAGDVLDETQTFDTDPQWESYRSRLVPNPVPLVRQHFGYRTTNHAGGKRAGEIGGWIQRSITPAWYAKAIAPKDLQNQLAASGRFAVTKNVGGSGMLFGWFNENSRGWRTSNSLGFRIDGNGNTFWVLFEYGTRNWLTGGGATFEGRYQTTRTKPFPADGTAHNWSLTYLPDAQDGQGMIRFVLDATEYTATLHPGHKADGASFNRFGMFNQQITGEGMEVYFDDIDLGDQAEDFSEDPRWESRDNDTEFEERAIRPMHDFGYSDSQHAGGKRGEIGGMIWRDEQPAYYGDKVGPFSLDGPLHASGKLAFIGAGSDSGIYFGWFNSTSKRNKTTPDYREQQKNVLGIAIEGPSRAGHYFRPVLYTSEGKESVRSSGPVIRPDGTLHHWSFDYAPSGADGNGRITLTLDESVQTFDVQPGARRSGAIFDRFGFFNMQVGGHYVSLYIDDLTYSKTRIAK